MSSLPNTRKYTYRKTGLAWLGEVPEHWQLKPLKYLCSFAGGGTPNKEILRYWVGGTIPWVSPKDMKSRRVSDTQDHVTLSAVEESSTNFVDPGAVLMVVRSGILQRTIPIAVNDVRVTLNQDMKALRFAQDGTAQYFVYLVHGQDVALRQCWLKEGATVESIDQDRLVNAVLPLPPLPEQTQIARFLDYETSRIDALIDKQQQLIALLKEKRQAVISHAVTKGLNPDAPMRDSGIEWLGEIPAHWEILRLNRVVASFVDYRGRTPEKTDSGRPLVTAGAIRNGIVDLARSPQFVSENTYHGLRERGIPAEGDLLFTSEAPLGEVALVEDVNIACAQRIIMFKINRARMLPEFLWLFLRSVVGQQSLRSRASGSTAEGIRADRLRATRIPTPSLQDQRIIAEHVRSALSGFGDVLERAETQINLLKERRTALISAAVTGKIDVRDWTPPTTSETP